MLLALDRSLASQLLHHFEQDEISTIRSAADHLEPITASDLEAIVEEFAGQFTPGMNYMGSPDEMHSLLNDALSSPDGESLSSEAENEQLNVPSVWQQLAEQSPEEVLLPYLLNEHPQTVAVILANLASDVSAKIVALMPQQPGADVVRRMLGLQEVHGDVLAMLEDRLVEELLSDEDAGATNAAHARIANMINRMDGDQRQQIIYDITESSPEEAEAIKKLLFSFEDIVKLSDVACQVLFGAVPTETTVMALQETDSALREKILSALSARSRRMVEAELAGDSDAAMEDIKEARLKVSGTALGLMESGQIEIEEDAE